MAKDVVFLQKIQSAALNINHQLDKVINHPDQAVKLWHWVNIHHQFIGTSKGETWLDHIGKVLHLGWVRPSFLILIVSLLQIAKGAKVARLEGAGTLAIGAGMLAPMG